MTFKKGDIVISMRTKTIVLVTRTYLNKDNRESFEGILLNPGDVQRSTDPDYVVGAKSDEWSTPAFKIFHASADLDEPVSTAEEITIEL